MYVGYNPGKIQVIWNAVVLEKVDNLVECIIALPGKLRVLLETFWTCENVGKYL